MGILHSVTCMTVCVCVCVCVCGWVCVLCVCGTYCSLDPLGCTLAGGGAAILFPKVSGVMGRERGALESGGSSFTCEAVRRKGKTLSVTTSTRATVT